MCLLAGPTMRVAFRVHGRRKFPPLTQELGKGDRREEKGGVERVEGGGDWGMGGRAKGGGGGGGTL